MKMINTNYVKLLLGPLAFLLIEFVLALNGLSQEGRHVLALTSWMGFWWITEAISIQATALLPLIGFPILNVMSLKSAAAPYAHPFIFLFFGGFILALAIEKWGLHRRIALKILHLFGSQPRNVIAGIMVATAFLSMWISNTATAVMMLPIAISVVQVLAAGKKFAESMLLGVAYSASIGGMATLIGTPPNIVFASFAEEQLHQPVTFFDWMMWATPISVILLIVVWWWLTKDFSKINLNSEQESKLNEMETLTSISSPEVRVLIVFILTALAWIFRTWLIEPFFPQVDDTIIAMIAAMLLFILPSGSFDKKITEEQALTTDERLGKFTPLIVWKDTKKISWGSLILFGGGLSLASAFDASGLAAWLTQTLTASSSLPPVILMVVILAFINFLTELTSNLATTVVALPLLLPVAASAGFNEYYFLAGVALSASCAFMLPVATPPNTIVFSSGEVTSQKMMKVGFKMNLISIVLIFIFVQLFSQI